MKVVFKLSPAQLLIATALKAVAEAAYAEDLAAYAADKSSGSPVMCGNAACTVDFGCGVAAQNLTLVGDTLTYEGGRTTLNYGTAKCLATIKKIFGGLDTAEDAIIGYETSQSYLPWHMTEIGGIEGGLTSFERLCEIASLYKEGYETDTIRAAMEKLGEMLPRGFANITRAKRAAQFTKEELQKFTAIEAALGRDYDPDELPKTKPNIFNESDEFVEIEEV